MFAKLENSPRLQSALKVLQEYRPSGVTGIELCRLAQIMNPGEVCSELRRQGYQITCVEEANSANRRRVFRYRLVEEPDGD